MGWGWECILFLCFPRKNLLLLNARCFFDFTENWWKDWRASRAWLVEMESLNVYFVEIHSAYLYLDEIVTAVKTARRLVVKAYVPAIMATTI